MERLVDLNGTGGEICSFITFFLGSIFLFQLQLTSTGMFKVYVPPEGKFSCPAVLDDAELRTQIIIGIDLFV